MVVNNCFFLGGGGANNGSFSTGPKAKQGIKNFVDRKLWFNNSKIQIYLYDGGKQLFFLGGGGKQWII